MLKLQVEQGSQEWFDARCGIPTASNFDKLITASMKPSSQAEDYLYTLMGEWVTGEKEFIPPTYWMKRGVEMEPEAREAYQFITDYEIEQVGLVYKDDDKLVSCSPDGLVTGMGLEIKCPSPVIHNAYYLQDKCPKKYMAQVQGGMWVCGLQAWDFVSYHPEYEPLIVTVFADEKWQKAFDKIIPPFIERLVEARQDPRAIALRESRLEREAA